MTDRKNLNEKMQDVSVTQDHSVPASLESSSGTGPPAVKIKEETAKDYVKSCGDKDFTKPPEVSLIPEMLTTVSNSNLNPLSPEFIPQSISETAIMKKARSKNNVAMASILESQEKKVPDKQPDMSKSSFSMFSRKSIPHKVKKVATVPSICSANMSNCCQYSPSPLANEYYSKYMLNNKLRENIKEDIWTRAEQQMREVDKRKTRGPEESSCSSYQDITEGMYTNSGVISFGQGMEVVSLLHHRHLSLDNIEDCVVCKVAAKHGYQFIDDEEYTYNIH